MTLADLESRLAIVAKLKAQRWREKRRLELTRSYATKQRIIGTIRGLSRAIRVVEKAT